MPRALNRLQKDKADINVLIRQHPYIFDPQLSENREITRTEIIQNIFGEESDCFTTSTLALGEKCGIVSALCPSSGRNNESCRIL